jgi:V8-like Glu-specific endopeptidase
MSCLSHLFRRLHAFSAHTLGNIHKTHRPSRTRTAGRCKPTLEQLDARLLPSLTPLSPNVGYPLRAVVKLYVTFPDHTSIVGSGALIDSFHVLTAAHMLYSYKDGGFATSVQAIPDQYYNSDPYGIAYGTYERVDPSWISFNPSNPGSTSPSVEDIGLVTLNRAVGNSTGSFAFGYNNNNSVFTNASFDTAGYPASYGYSGQQMYFSAGRLIGTLSNDGLGFYEGNITIYPGQSGSPLWQYASNGTPVIYGVIAGSYGYSPSSEAFGARITQSVFNEIQSWRNSDRPPTSPYFAKLSSSGTPTLSPTSRLLDAGTTTDAIVGASEDLAATYGRTVAGAAQGNGVDHFFATLPSATSTSNPENSWGLDSVLTSLASAFRAGGDSQEGLNGLDLDGGLQAQPPSDNLAGVFDTGASFSPGSSL